MPVNCGAWQGKKEVFIKTNRQYRTFMSASGQLCYWHHTSFKFHKKLLESIVSFKRSKIIIIFKLLTRVKARIHRFLQHRKGLIFFMDTGIARYDSGD
jgi:hypothetical protein